MNQDTTLPPPSLEILRDILKSSKEIQLSILSLVEEDSPPITITASFIYDLEDPDAINLEFYVSWINTPRVLIQDFHHTLSIAIDSRVKPSDDAKIAFGFPPFCIQNVVVTTHRAWDQNRLKSVETVTDWSQTITDLWNKGIVETTETKSALAIDKRKFWFRVGGADASEAIDVDCLGTTMCTEISEKVLDAWNKVNQKSELLEDYYTLKMIEKKSEEIQIGLITMIERRKPSKKSPLFITLDLTEKILAEAKRGLAEFALKYPDMKSLSEPTRGDTLVLKPVTK